MILERLREHFFLKEYRSRGGEEAEKYLKFLLESSISQLAFMAKYKELPGIEQMPEKEKKEMKMYVIGLFPEKSTEEKLIACKMLYTIGTLL